MVEPPMVEKYLGDDEEILESHGKNYLTENRVIFHEKGFWNEDFKDLGYEHITSLQHGKYRNYGLVIGGLFAFIVSFLLFLLLRTINFFGTMNMISLIVLTPLMFLGLALFVYGFIPRRKSVIKSDNPEVYIQLEDTPENKKLLKRIREKIEEHNSEEKGQEEKEES